MLLQLTREMVRAAGGTVRYVDTDGLEIDLSLAELHQIRWRLDELLDVPPDTRSWTHSLDSDGYWIRVPEPRLLKFEPENIDGPSGFRSTLHAAVLAAKKHHLYRLDWCGPHVELIDDAPVVVEPTGRELAVPVGLRIIRPSWHQLDVHAPRNELASGLEHLLRIDWEMKTSVPTFWGLPGYRIVPAASIEMLHLHPDLTPFAPVAAARIPLVGTVIASWHSGFEPADAEWKDANGDQYAPFATGRNKIGMTIGQFLVRAWRAFDGRLVDVEGTPCGPGTIGPVSYGPTIGTRFVTTGKESRGLGIGRGVLFRPDTATYSTDDLWPDVLSSARRLGKATTMLWRLQELSGLSERGLRLILSRKRSPWPSTREAVIRATAILAREEIRRQDAFGPVPTNDLDTIARYLAEVPEPQRSCQMCGRALMARQVYWCGEACRKKFGRQPSLPMETGR